MPTVHDLYLQYFITDINIDEFYLIKTSGLKCVNNMSTSLGQFAGFLSSNLFSSYWLYIFF